MIFQSAQPNAHYRMIRLVSGEGRWEIGVSLYATGARLRMGLSGRPPSVMDFCMGRDASVYAPLVCAVLDRLEPLAETLSGKEIDAVFPWAGTRPDLTVHLPELLADGGENMADSPAGARTTRMASQMPKASVTKAFNQRLVKGKIGQP